jgi:hypothetical protein
MKIIKKDKKVFSIKIGKKEEFYFYSPENDMFYYYNFCNKDIDIANLSNTKNSEFKRFNIFKDDIIIIKGKSFVYRNKVFFDIETIAGFKMPPMPKFNIFTEIKNFITK